jgi:dephospho-CoA kinase
LTGGIAEGKSTVLGFFADLGVPTYSADQIAREALLDPDVSARLDALLGLEGATRADIRERALGDDAFRRKLNHLAHPWVSAKLGDFHGVAEIPLLIETVRFSAMDVVIVVTCGPGEQRRRLVERVGDEELADRLLAIQLPTSVKIRFADAVIRTNESMESVQLQTRRVLDQIHWPEN